MSRSDIKYSHYLVFLIVVFLINFVLNWFVFHSDRSFLNELIQTLAFSFLTTVIYATIIELWNRKQTQLY